MEKLLRALHYLFHKALARRYDYIKLTESSEFPLPFCGHRWIENLPVVERVIDIWPNIIKFVNAVAMKKVPNPNTSSYDTVAAATTDSLIEVKLKFFMTIASSFTPFLTKYQIDTPMLPFLIIDLTNLIKNLLKRFIKKDQIEKTAARISKMDVADKDIQVSYKEVDIGIGAGVALKSLQRKGTVSDLRVMEFKKECLKGLTAMCKKILDKYPIKFPIVRLISSLNPRHMFSSPDQCLKLFQMLVEILVQEHHVRNSSDGDVIIQQYSELLDKESRDDSFENFNYTSSEVRVDTFLYCKIKAYPKLCEICRKLLLLSHGQATVERASPSTKRLKCIIWKHKL